MGKAVQNGMAQLMDGNGQVLTQGKIDKGMAKLNIPEGTDIIRINSENDALTQPFDHSSLMEDSSSGPFRNRHNIDLLSFYAENVKTLPGELDLPGIDIDQYDLRQVYMFTDRSMYQPGETAHIKGLVRNLRGNTIGMPTQENAVLSITGKDDQGNDFKGKPVQDSSKPPLHRHRSHPRLEKTVAQYCCQRPHRWQIRQPDTPLPLQGSRQPRRLRSRESLRPYPSLRQARANRLPRRHRQRHARYTYL